MQHIPEKLQFRAGRLCNVTMGGPKFKNISVYELGGDGIKSVFKSYQDSIPED